MTRLRSWFIGVWGQLSAGWILLGMLDGHKKFRALLWRNILASIFFLFDILLLPSLAVFWAFRGTALTPLYYLIATCTVWSIASSLFLSIFDLPRFIVEKRRLDEAITITNPFHIFIIIPLHSLCRR